MPSKIFSVLFNWHRKRRCEGELLGLSDRLLNDIGLDRGFLQHAVLYGHDIDMSDYPKD
jgi:hypothetical protein